MHTRSTNILAYELGQLVLIFGLENVWIGECLYSIAPFVLMVINQRILCLQKKIEIRFIRATQPTAAEQLPLLFRRDVAYLSLAVAAGTLATYLSSRLAAGNSYLSLSQSQPSTARTRCSLFCLKQPFHLTLMLNRFPRRYLSISTSEARPWLFVGLGNPGEKYKGTRHNVGFEMVDAFAEAQGIPVNTPLCKALFGQGFVCGAPVLLSKPQTYMNLSGESSGPLAAYYKLPLNRVLVFHDDMELPCGVLRLTDKGGHGSHNGLKSVIHHFRGNREFARLRIGIGRPPGQMDPKAFVLQKFNANARERIDAALPEGVGVLKSILCIGLTESARRFNSEQKYKHIRVQTMPTY